MTNPQDLADRVEKALNLLRVACCEAAVSFRDAWKFDKARYDLADLIWTADNGQMILASLRRSAPVSGEMGEAVISWAYQYKNKYTDGGWSNNYKDFHCGGRVPTSREEGFKALMKRSENWIEGTEFRLVELSQTTVFHLLPLTIRTPSGETREEAGS